MSALVSRLLPRSPLGSLLIGLVIGIVVTIGVGSAIVAPLALLHHGENPVEVAYGHGMVGLISRIGAAGISSNPVANDPRAVQHGRFEYTGSCAQCHGAKGDGRGMFGLSTYPPATDLTSHDVKEKSDAQLFFIIKNGLSFTPMPGYADQYSDQDIWAIVSFLRALQNGQPGAEAVPTPTDQQLVFATVQGGSTAQRGAEVYFAQGCAACHGAIGNAPGRLALRERRGVAEAVRNGRPGMPCYGTDTISNAELRDLQSYVSSMSGSQSRGEGEGDFGRRGGGDNGSQEGSGTALSGSAASCVASAG